MSTVLKGALALICTVPIALATVSPAEAGDRWTYRSSGERLSSTWVEVGTLNGVAGNVHTGELTADPERDEVYGSVTDWTCPAGELPPTGGGHGEYDEEQETNCVVESVREIFADDAIVDVTLDKRLDRGTITGSLVVADHGGGVTGRPPVAMTFTGIGATASSTTYETGSDGSYSYTYRTSTSTRQAAVTGFIGAMGFTDDADDTSTGEMERYRTSERGTSR